LKLTVVGSAPAWTRRPGRASSCYLVEDGDSAIALDFGQGAFSELSRYRSPDAVAGILVSHLHADHLVDLIPLRHFLRFEAEARVRLHGPRQLRDRIDAFQAERDFLAALPGEPLRPGRFEVAGFSVDAAHVTHIPDSFAFRVAVGDGPGLVYSGDCGVADDLLPLIREGDTLLCEAAFGADEQAGGGNHLTARQAADAARRGGAGRLVLTHLLDRSGVEPAELAARDGFAGPVQVARPGLELALG
jgi:ribonuclease BN (tRNA processing enzyme)